MSEKKKTTKIGYQAPKGQRINSGFMEIKVQDMHYCYSHDFWYNTEEQDKLLHEGKPCFYTDGYVDGRQNFYREGSMLWDREGFTLKKAKRLIRKTRNLPIGTVVNIGSNFCYVGKKRTGSLGYNYKVRKENKFDPEYTVMRPSYFKNFNTDQKGRDLIDLLRANGFLVSVSSKNTNFISGMISNAAMAIGKTIEADDEEGETATAYGHGLRVGISSNDSTFNGYTYGIKSILFDKWDEFDKWSRCREISKEKSNEEILQILLDVKNETD